MRNVRDESYRENKNMYFVFNNFFPLESSAVYEMAWKNVVEAHRPQMNV
jgi:hypothetical protein